MNRNEESSLPGITSMPSISRHVESSSNPTGVVPLWCDLGFFPNSRGNKAAANLRSGTVVGANNRATFPELTRIFDE